MNRLKRRLVVNGAVSILAILSTLALSVGAQAETWELANTPGFGTSNNRVIIPLVEFDGDLYAGTSNPSSGGELWRSSDGTTWALVPQSAGGFGNDNNESVWPSPVFNEDLYVHTADNNVTGAEIWRSSNGTDWTTVTPSGFGSTDNYSINQLEVFNGWLYAGAENSVDGVGLWRSANGDSWEQVNSPGFGDSANNQIWLTFFNDYFYAGTGKNNFTGGQLWRSASADSTSSWTTATVDGFGNSDNTRLMAATGGILDGYLYINTANSVDGGQLFRSSNGTTWDESTTPGFGDVANYKVQAPFSVNGKLYAGTNNNNGLQIWVTSDGTSWTTATPDGFGDSNNVGSWIFTAYKGRVYVGTQNNTDGGEIWALSFDNIPSGSNVSTDLATGVTIEFSSVSSGGSAAVNISNEPPADEPSGFSLLGTYYDISTNATYSGDITITIPYDESQVVGDEEDLELFHWDGTSWEVVPSTVDTVGNTITGQVSSLSIIASGSANAGSPATGMNANWLVFLAFSLTLIGGYLVLKNRTDLFRQI